MGKWAKNSPHALKHIFGVLVLLFADEEVAVLGRAAFDAHELIELEHPPLAAAVPLAALVEDGHARVVHALLVLAALAARVCRGAGFALAGCVGGDGERDVIVLVGFLGRGLGRGGRDGRGDGGLGLREAGWFGCWSGGVGDVGGGFGGFDGGCVVDFRVGARGAGGDGEEFVEG